MTRLVAELDLADAVLTEVPLNRHVAQAMRRIARSDVPDMPDRIIAATALYLAIPIISRDRKIRASDLKTIW
jgi:predicted nucleic acid-binding protein